MTYLRQQLANAFAVGLALLRDAALTVQLSDQFLHLGTTEKQPRNFRPRVFRRRFALQTHDAACLKFPPVRVRHASRAVLIASANPTAVHLNNAHLRCVFRGDHRSFARGRQRVNLLLLMKGLHPSGLLLLHLPASFRRQLRDPRGIQVPVGQLLERFRADAVGLIDSARVHGLASSPRRDALAIQP